MHKAKEMTSDILSDRFDEYLCDNGCLYFENVS